MKKVLATIVKEWLLMSRDIPGIVLLFVMPVILIIVMALIEDAPFKDYQEFRFDILIVDNDHGALAQEIKTGLRQSKNFKVIDSVDGKPLNDVRLKELLKQGFYRVGIIIPQGATAEVVNASNIVANSVSKKIGLGTMPAREIRNNSFVRMYFDPIAKPTFRLSINFALDRYITFSCSNLLVKRLSKLGKTEGVDSSQNDDFKKIFQGIGVREEALSNKAADAKFINSVQHNVPAWAIFAMFFIAIPIAGHMIREREEGSALRIELIPNSYVYMALGRIIFYTFICTLQFIFMFAIGIWFLPLLGLPKLYLGIHPEVILFIAIAIAFTATAYGHFVGAIFKTTNQAMPFGAISIVILSALGGVWVPADLLPEKMKTLTMISPLHWGFEAINQIILRNGGFKDVVVNLIILLSFGVVFWLVSTYMEDSRRRSV
jgi:ABC-2 type transport system permease protein